MAGAPMDGLAAVEDSVFPSRSNSVHWDHGPRVRNTTAGRLVSYCTSTSIESHTHIYIYINNGYISYLPPETFLFSVRIYVYIYIYIYICMYIHR